MVFQPGNVSNPSGRPKGSRNKRTEELWRRLEARGDQDPGDLLSAVASNENEPKELRIQAATNLLPYKYSKMGSTAPLRYIEEPVILPHPNPTTEHEISANIAHIVGCFAAGTLEIDFYNALLLGQHQHVNALKAREDLPANQDIHITDGLPPLPGTNITMPERPTLNGHQATNILSPPEPRILPDLDPDTAPVIPPDDPPPGGNQ